MEQTNHDLALRIYNAFYCDATYRAATARAEQGDMRVFGYEGWQVGSMLTDAALECCGHEFYRGCARRLLMMCEQHDPLLGALCIVHLENFATLDHVFTLAIWERENE